MPAPEIEKIVRSSNLAIAVCIASFSFLNLIFNSSDLNFVLASLILFGFALTLVLIYSFLPIELLRTRKVFALSLVSLLLILLSSILTLPAAPFIFLLPLIFLGASVTFGRNRTLVLFVVGLLVLVSLYVLGLNNTKFESQKSFEFLAVGFLSLMSYFTIVFLEKNETKSSPNITKNSTGEVYRAMDSLKGVLNYETLISLIPYSINSLFGFDQSFLFKFKNEKLQLESLHVGGYDKGEIGNLMSTCIGKEECFHDELLRGEIAEIANLTEKLSKSEAGTTWIKTTKIKKVVVMPLRIGNSLFGALVAASNHSEDTVNKDELGIFATTVVLALENATFYTKAKETSEAYNAILTQMGSGVLVTDQNNKVTLLNQAGEEMLGKKSQTVIDKNAFEVLTPFDEKGELIKTANNPIAKADKEKGLTFDQNVFISRSSGDRLPVDLSAKTIQDETGKKIGLVIVFRDITKDLEIEKTRNEFISIASHELRTPMTAIKGFVSMVMDGDAGKVPPKVMEFLKMAQEGNERLIRLVEDLLNVSRIEGGRIQLDKKEVDLVETTKLVVSDLMYHAGASGILVNYEIEKNLPKVNADNDKLREILINLVGNAIKYTQKGGKVSISHEVSGWSVTTSISDTGIGIPKEEIPNLFKKFYRVPNEMTMKREGTGLGLFITKQLIELMGGTVKVSSELGKGTTFQFDLPMVESQKAIVNNKIKTGVKKSK